MDYRDIYIPGKDEPKELGKRIGTGGTASVYEWSKGKVIKVFKKDYPIESITMEYNNALALKKFSFKKAIAYELKKIEESYGIVYSYVQGESLLDYLFRTGDIEVTAKHMATLHKEILECRITAGITTVRDFLHNNITNSPQATSAASKEMLRIVDLLPEGDVLCHGDFCPGNIILTEDGPVVIDFMNVCRGDALYDIARTLYLIKYTPTLGDATEKEKMQKLQCELGQLYLDYMGTTEIEVGRYLSMIISARSGEL